MSNDGLKQCKGGNNCHEINHLCQIVAKRDMGRVKELVKDAKFFCKNCGRAAGNRENLCNPSSI